MNALIHGFWQFHVSHYNCLPFHVHSISLLIHGLWNFHVLHCNCLSFHDPCARKHFPIYTLILAFLCVVLQFPTFSWSLAESNRFYITVATHVLFTCFYFYFYFLIFEKYMLLFKWPCELFLARVNSHELRASFYCC